jgi:hypothetical protein
MGLVAAAVVVAGGGEAFRMFTSIGAAIPDVTADPALQAAIIHGTALDITGALLLFGSAFSGWLVMVATPDDVREWSACRFALVLGLLVLVQVRPPRGAFSPPWPLWAWSSRC